MMKMDKNSMILAVLIMIQPILDICSYFASQIEMTGITSVLRLAIFAAIMVYAFILSDHKKIYGIFAGVLGVYWIIHMVICARDGYALVSDVNGFLRTVQMPALTLAFITLFKRSEKFPQEVGKYWAINYLTIAASILLSFALGMPESTYQSGLGVKGWFMTGNSQSYIIAVMAMLAMYYFYNKKNNIAFLLTMVVAFVQMFLFGTLVTLYSIFITAGVFLVIMLWNREKRWIMAGGLILAIVVTLLALPYSPSRQQGANEDQALSRWEDMLEEQEKDPDQTPEEEIHNLDETILKPLVDRFGYDKVLEVYGGSIEAEELMDSRQRKVNFGRLVMAEQDIWVWLFGFEDADMLYGDETYDPENDFPAIFFFYGIVGILLYVVFLVYFAVILCKDIFKNLKKLPVEKVILGLSLIFSMGCAELSANVLRRPNASFFISLMLAYVYYLCKVQKERDYESESDHPGVQRPGLSA